MFIPGILIAYLTFPGVIVHEIGHMVFCRLRKVPVLDVCYFRFENPPGYVVHEKPGDFLSTFLISIGPFLVNSVLCILICFPAFVPMKAFDIHDPLSYLLIWLGVSIGMHAFPSNQDASILWNEAGQAARNGNLLAVISFPLVILVYVANIGRIFWLDTIYGVALGCGLPMLLLDKMS
jgi:hypothetical protein